MTTKKTPPTFDEKCRIIIKLGEAAHKYGAEAMRLESYLLQITESLGIEGQFYSNPTNIIFAFRENDKDWQKINLTSVSGALDLTKLLEVDEIVNDVIAGNLNSAEAEDKIKEVAKAPEAYGSLILAFGYVVSGAGIAGLLSGSYVDIIFSSILSLIVFGIVWLGGRYGGWVNRGIPISTAFVAGVFTAVIKYFIPELNYVLVTLAAIIVLIPGYSISLGVAEAVNNHVVSGFTNIINGVVYLLKQFVGVLLAFAIVISLWAVPTAASTPVDSIWLWILVPAFMVGLVIVFQTPPEYFLWAFLSCALGYLGVNFGSDWMGSNVGNLIGAIVVGVFANSWERKTGKPGSIVLVPAITVLVGGSIGFRGLMATAQGQANGVAEFNQMFLIALTLTAGLVIANTLVKPTKSL